MKTLQDNLPLDSPEEFYLLTRRNSRFELKCQDNVIYFFAKDPVWRNFVRISLVGEGKITRFSRQHGREFTYHYITKEKVSSASRVLELPHTHHQSPA